MYELSNNWIRSIGTLNIFPISCRGKICIILVINPAVGQFSSKYYNIYCSLGSCYFPHLIVTLCFHVKRRTNNKCNIILGSVWILGYPVVWAAWHQYHVDISHQGQTITSLGKHLLLLLSLLAMSNPTVWLAIINIYFKHFTCT